MGASHASGDVGIFGSDVLDSSHVVLLNGEFQPSPPVDGCVCLLVVSKR